MSELNDTQINVEETPKDKKFQNWDFRFKVATTISSILTVFSLIIGGFLTAQGYFDKKNQEIQEKMRDYEFSLYKERKETLYPLCNAAADIVSSKSLKEAAKAIKTFETLYYGEVGIIAEGPIADAIKSFAESLLEYKGGSDDASPPFELISMSSELATKCKEILNLEKVYGIAKEK